mgnify:CR=1 FL=1
MGKDTSKDIPFEIFYIIKQLVKTDKVYKANDLKKLLPVDSVTKGWAHPTNTECGHEKHHYHLQGGLPGGPQRATCSE